MAQDPSPKPAAEEPALRHAVAALQNRIAAAFGVQPADREATVKAMLERSSKGSAGYWLQLLLAMGIASLGLVLGSTAVVIGAMLISPLMGPIVELGMGLAIGSPFLVMRSFIRTAVSIAVVISCAALLTLLLPFHEVTAEIAARTSPTVLDLSIAIFCAIAAAYTAARPSSDTTATAAGTAIGIALVPPLCVIGYGIGTGARSIATGAALLFTANFCAILLFAVLCFLLLGYGAVSTGELEQAELARQPGGALRRVARALQVVFASRLGPLLRVLMPVLFFGSVYLPLREALAQVTWQVRVRTAIQRMLAALPQDTVRSSIVVEHQGVVVRLVTLGRAEDAAKLERELKDKIAATAGVVPKVSVIAVPNASALEEVAATVKASSTPVEVVRKEPDVTLLRERFGGALSRAWPKEAGPLVLWRLELPEGAPTIVEVIHSGPALGAPGAALLGGELSRDLATAISVRDVAVSPEPIIAEPDAGIAWLSAALRSLEELDAVDAMHGCVEVPEAKKGKPVRDVEPILAALHRSPAFQAGRLHINDGVRWRAVVSLAPCAEPRDVAADGGVQADAAAAQAER